MSWNGYVLIWLCIGYFVGLLIGFGIGRETTLMKIEALKDEPKTRKESSA